jgi:hypothetical protein
MVCRRRQPASSWQALAAAVASGSLRAAPALAWIGCCWEADRERRPARAEEEREVVVALDVIETCLFGPPAPPA